MSPATVSLDMAGQATVTTGDVDNSSSDNCSGSTLAVSPTTLGASGNVTLTATDASGNTANCIAAVTDDPFVPALVPTLSQWGLIILVLMMMAMATVALMATNGRVQTTSSASLNMFAPKSLPFEMKGFTKILAIVLAITIIIFAVAMVAFGYELTDADVPGTLIASPIAAYVLHLWFGVER